MKNFKTRPPRLVRADEIGTLVRESDALVKSYLDGAGLFAWQLNGAGDAYEPVRLAESERVTELDDVLHKIASQIKRLSRGAQGPPAPIRPPVRSVGDTESLLEEAPDQDD